MLKPFFLYFRKYKLYLAVSCICVVMECVFELVIPLIMADIIDVGVAARDGSYILTKGVIMVSCALVSLLLGIIYARLAAKAGQGFGAQLREAEFKKVQEFSFSNMDHFSTSSLVTRLTNDITILQNAVCNGIRPRVLSLIHIYMCIRDSPCADCFLYFYRSKIAGAFDFIRKSIFQLLAGGGTV